MIVLNSEQIMRAESEHGARSFMDVIGDCYSFFLSLVYTRTYCFYRVRNYINLCFKRNTIVQTEPKVYEVDRHQVPDV